jgi:hypothetical protein
MTTPIHKGETMTKTTEPNDAPKFDVVMHGPGPYSKADVMLILGEVARDVADRYFKLGAEAGARATLAAYRPAEPPAKGAA